jgi:hypothetical protein
VTVSGLAAQDLNSLLIGAVLHFTKQDQPAGGPQIGCQCGECQAWVKKMIYLADHLKTATAEQRFPTTPDTRSRKDRLRDHRKEMLELDSIIEVALAEQERMMTDASVVLPEAGQVQ